MKLIKNILIITIPTLLLIFLILELFFRFGIKANEFPMHYFDKKDKIYKFDTNYQRDGEWAIGKFAEIRGDWHINNQGWNDNVDYHIPRLDTTKKLISFFGDSQLESFIAGVDSNIVHFLRKDIGAEYDIFKFGKSGAPFSQYLHMSRYCNKYWDSDIFVFMIVHNDFNESIAEIARRPLFNQLSLQNNDLVEVLPTPPNNSFIYNSLISANYYSAFFRYLFYNLKLTNTLVNNRFFYKLQSSNVKKKYNANIDVDKLSKNKTIHKKAFTYFIEQCLEENPNKRIIVMMNAPQEDIYNNNFQNGKSNVIWSNNMVADICKSYNIEFIDLSMPMLEDWNKNKMRFNPTIDGHWNPYAHKLAAEQLKKFILKK